MSPLYWAIVLISSLLGYGFYFTNASVTLDDEILELYYNSGFVAQNRWSFSFWGKLLNCEDYLPGWTETLGVILMVFGITLVCYTIRLLTRDKVPYSVLGIFAGIVCSYPFIGAYTVMQGYSIELGVQFLFLGIIATSLNRLFSVEVKNWKNLVLPTIYIIVSLVLSGAEVILPMSGLLLFLLLYCTNLNNDSSVASEWSWKKNVAYTFAVLILFLFGLVLYRLISLFVFGVKDSYGIRSYLLYDYSKGLVQGFLRPLVGVIRSIAVSYSSVKHIAIQMMGCSYLLLIIVSLLNLIIYKNVKQLVCMFMATVFAFSLFLFTGNITIVHRMLYWNGLYVAFSFLAAYLLFNSFRPLFWRRIKYAVCVLGVFCIIYGSQELSRIAYADYRCFLIDQAMSQGINRDILKLTGGNRPTNIVFMGFPYYMFSPYGWYGRLYDSSSLHNGLGNVDSSYFLECRLFNYDLECENERLINFFNMNLGTEYKRPDEFDRKLANQRVAQMPCWPQEGSVVNFGDYILVKLGDSNLEEFAMNRDEFERGFDHHRADSKAIGSLYAVGTISNGVWNLHELNESISTWGWAIIDGIDSYNCRSRIALISDNTQYTLATTFANSFDKSIFLEDANHAFSDFTSVSIPQAELKSGTYDIAIIVSSSFSEDSYLINTEHQLIVP